MAAFDLLIGTFKFRAKVVSAENQRFPNPRLYVSVLLALFYCIFSPLWCFSPVSLLYDYYCWRYFPGEVNMNVSPRAKYVVTIKMLVVVSLLLQLLVLLVVREL